MIDSTEIEVHFQTILKRFFPAAVEICNEILAFQPDLVIGLMHSGRLPLYAGMELWKRSQEVRFPPTLLINLGREKFKRYDVIETRPRITSVFDGDFEEDDGIAFFHAWLYEQKTWQDELRDLIRVTLGDAEPANILIVDDVISEGSTRMLVLGLLNLANPNAQVRFYSSNTEYKNVFLAEWARRHHPSLIESDLFPEQSDRGYMRPRYEAAAQMVVGTEDVDIESLRWKHVETASPSLETISAYLPVADWMALPRFAEQIILDEIAAHAAEYVPNPVPREDRRSLRPGIMVMREIYLHGPLTLREISEHLGWTLAKTRYHADKQIGREYLIVTRDNGVNRISLSPRTDPDYFKKRSDVDTYWVLPGQLLAGGRPGFNMERPEKQRLLSRLRWLLDSGVTFFIHLFRDTINEMDDYEAVLKEMASVQKKEVKYVQIRVPLWHLPRPTTIQSILDLIDDAINQGHVIYLHNDFDHVTETVIGCYLVRHGMRGMEALKELERLRQGTRDDWRRAPAKANARRLVRRWAGYEHSAEEQSARLSS